MKEEIIRKTIHSFGLSVPIFYYFTNRMVTLILLCIFLLLFLLSNYYRIKYLQKIPLVGYFLSRITRKHERNGLGGDVYFTAGCLVVIFFVEKNVAIASILMLVIGDMFAAINGQLFGKIKIYKNKTIVGTLSCFFSCFVIGYLILGTPAAFIGATVATISELQDIVNDNFAIPVFTGLAIHFLCFSEALL